MSAGRHEIREGTPLAWSERRTDDLDRILPSREEGRRTRILGILNLTPDSFHDGGADSSPAGAVARGRQLVAEGADALDLGAESTRPDADPVPEAEELDRLLPVLDGLRDAGVPLSVDTTKARVADEALRRGATLVNDVSGLQRDEEIAAVCARHDAGLVLMHMRGEPRTMRSLADYRDVVEETLRFLEERIDLAVRLGVPERNLIVDPGLGFAKSVDHNLRILRRLPEYLTLGRPVLVGASRKSFLARYDGAASEDRLEATLATSTLAVIGGASILRVHDVRANRRAVLLTESVLGARDPGRSGEASAC
ncbi:MAG TPA: dihydropteroate synthase [bacterium]|nr:dihydropteroate synthase [bacterium]